MWGNQTLALVHALVPGPWSKWAGLYQIREFHLYGDSGNLRSNVGLAGGLLPQPEQLHSYFCSLLKSCLEFRLRKRSLNESHWAAGTRAPLRPPQASQPLAPCWAQALTLPRKAQLPGATQPAQGLSTRAWLQARDSDAISVDVGWSCRAFQRA